MNLRDLHIFYFYDKQTDNHDKQFDDCGQTVLLHQEYCKYDLCFHLENHQSYHKFFRWCFAISHSRTYHNFGTVWKCIAMIQVRSHLWNQSHASAHQNDISFLLLRIQVSSFSHVQFQICLLQHVFITITLMLIMLDKQSKHHIGETWGVYWFVKSQFAITVWISF